MCLRLRDNSANPKPNWLFMSVFFFIHAFYARIAESHLGTWNIYYRPDLLLIKTDTVWILHTFRKDAAKQSQLAASQNVSHSRLWILQKAYRTTDGRKFESGIFVLREGLHCSILLTKQNEILEWKSFFIHRA